MPSSDEAPSFHTFYEELISRKTYDFLHCRLVYSDVDDTRPEHRQTLIDQAISELPAEFERTESGAIHDRLIELILKGWNVEPHGEGYVYHKSRAVAMLEKVYRGGALDEEIISSLFILEHSHESFLHVVCGQGCRTHKRRVILLLDVIDTEQTTAMGVTEGYATAFDPADHRLMIKSFHSDKDTHPWL